MAVPSTLLQPGLSLEEVPAPPPGPMVGSHIAGRVMGFLEGESGSALAAQLLPLPLEPLDGRLARELLPIHLGQNHRVLPWRKEALRNPALQRPSPSLSDPGGPGLALLPLTRESSPALLPHTRVLDCPAPLLTRLHRHRVWLFQENACGLLCSWGLVLRWGLCSGERIRD